MKKPLFETNPGTCRLQVYLSSDAARQLTGLAELQNKSASRFAAEMIRDMLAGFASGGLAVPAPAPTKRQKRLA